MKIKYRRARAATERANVAMRVAELLTLAYATDLSLGSSSRRRTEMTLGAAAVLRRLDLDALDVMNDHCAVAGLEAHAVAVCADDPQCQRCPLVSFCSIGRSRIRTINDGAMTVVDLFAGAGGLSLGFRRAGFRVVLAVEMDRDAAQTYRLNHPGVPVLEINVSSLTAMAILDMIGGIRPTAVCAGPPCQSYSAAGPRLAIDPRHRLYRHVINLSHDLRPRMLIIENVPGMEERRVGSRSYREIVEEELGEHFAVESYVLDATSYGVPQERRRLIFFCRPEGSPPIGKPEPTSHPDGSLDLPRTPTVVESLARFPRRGSGSTTDTAMVSGVLTRNLATMKHSPRVVEKIRGILPGKGPLSYRRVPKRFAKTVIAGHRALPVHHTAHRTMSVREAAALQGFPDNYAFAGPRANQPLQVANAVPPPFAEAIGNHVRTYLEQHGDD